MLKENKKTLILTTIVLLLPIIIGLILLERLPDKVPTHWNFEGVIDGWSSKPFAVFGLPGILLAVHWVCMLATCADPKMKDAGNKMLNIVLWICPILSVVLMAIVYGVALGYEFKVDKIVLVLVGVVFVIIGNYLPKCKQSYTMGIKLPWTLNDEDNWNRTHRLGGKLWVICGIIMIISMFLPANFQMVMMLLVIGIAVVIPSIYSYCLYKKKETSGE